MSGNRLSEEALIAAGYFLRQYNNVLRTELHNTTNFDSVSEKTKFRQTKIDSLAALADAFAEFYKTLHQYHFAKQTEQTTAEQDVQKLKLINNSFYIRELHLETFRAQDPNYYEMLLAIQKRAKEIISTAGIRSGYPQSTSSKTAIIVEQPENKSAIQIIASWKVEIALSILCLFLFALSQYIVTHQVSINKNYFVLLIFAILCSITLGRVLFLSVSKLIRNKSSAQVRRIIEYCLLPLIPGTLIYWFYLSVSASHTNAPVIHDQGNFCVGYVINKRESLLTETGRYKIYYHFLDGFDRWQEGEIIVDELTFKSYNLWDKVGIYYESQNPDSWRVFVSDGTRQGERYFPSGDFDSTSIFELRKYLIDTSGVLSFLQTIDFTFEGPVLIDTTTYLYSNSHRFQRIIIHKNQYIEITSMFLSNFSSPLPNGVKIHPVDSSFGDRLFLRDDYIFAAKSLHELIIPFDHYRIYLTDSVNSPTFVPSPYIPTPDAERYKQITYK